MLTDKANETQKTIMILGASILQLPAIEKAVEMGLKVVALDMNPEAVGFNVPSVIKEVISTIDIPAAVEAAKRHHIDGVMTLATDMPMRTVAAVAKECGIVGVSEDTAVKATDKSVMREALKAVGVPVPKFFRVTNKEEFKAAVDQIEGPFMVKPADSSGSRGILKVEERENLDSTYEYTKHFSHNGVVVVEECMTGPEVSVETLAIDGEVHVIQITDKITTGAPHFVEMGHTQPTRLDCAEEIRKVAVAANKAIGIENGPSHTEIIVTEDGPKIVELGARLGGDCITTHLVPLSTGVNMVEACIKIALGEKPSITPTMYCGSAIRYFHQHAGVVKSIEGLTEAEGMPGVKQISIVHGVGEKITEITDSGSRMGFVIAQGVDAEDAAYNSETAMASIHVEVL
ncbi:MAG: ATP-grasp domain-containing protein [Eubacterium sp.]|nr:ATP-grasp domain-containing protein [Eubacterium sp.]